MLPSKEAFPSVYLACRDQDVAPLMCLRCFCFRHRTGPYPIVNGIAIDEW